MYTKLICFLSLAVVCTLVQGSGGSRSARCFLPVYSGSYHKRELVRYAYNPESKSCEPFMFHGCGQNGNNFKTKEHCEHVCILTPKERQLSAEKAKEEHWEVDYLEGRQQVGEETENGPVVEEPVEEVPVDEAPVEEVAVDEAPVEEVPVEEAPVEEPLF